MTISVILAAGKGKRFKNQTINKTVALLNNKPLISYAMAIAQKTTSSTIVVIGHKSDSVVEAIKKTEQIDFAIQKHRLGTGHALKIALDQIAQKKLDDQNTIMVGYADHMFLYTPELIQEMIQKHNEFSPAVTLVTTQYPDPDKLCWGRIVRNNKGFINNIVEQKDASDEEKKITELNAGLYLFNYGFLKRNIKKLKKSPHTGEYYLTDLIHFAVEEKLKVSPFLVDFDKVGFGVNTPEQLKENEILLKKQNLNPQLF